MQNLPTQPHRLGLYISCMMANAGFLSLAHASDYQAPSSNDTLATISVTASREVEQGDGPVKGYVAKRSTTGTKTDTPILETPQAITVVTQDQIQATGARTVVEALGYSAGLFNPAGFNPANETFTIRGFTQYGGMLRDGLYDGGAWGNRQESYGLERVEFLKGAASVLYGKLSPGGAVNTISKRPSDEPLHEVKLELGNYNHQQFNLDVSDALNADETLKYRLTAVARQSDTPVDYTANDRYYLAPALSWTPNDKTSLTLLGNYQENKLTFINGLPVEGTLLPNKNGQLRKSTFLGEPDWSTGDDEKGSIGYLLEHQFSDQLKLEHKLRYSYSKVHWRYSSINLDANDQRTATRSGYDRFDKVHRLVADTFLEWKTSGARFENTLITGVDWLRENGSMPANWDLNLTPIDIFNPQYSGLIDYSNSLDDYSTDQTKTLGVYAQNQLKLDDHWVLLAGLRQDWVKSKATGSTDDKDDALTGRAGLVYLLDNGLAPYLSFSQSFEPVSGDDGSPAHRKLEPTQGEQYEAGLRYQPTGSNSLYSLALYQLTQSNVSSTDPTTQIVRQIGEVRSRGAELEAKFSPLKDVNLIAAYSYIDAKTTQSLIAAEVNQRTANVPRQQASLWADYHMAQVGNGQLKLGLGVRYIGEQTNASMNDARANRTPDVTLLDALINYDLKPFSLSLNLVNLAGKTYYSQCSYNSCQLGSPRTVIGSLAYRW